MNENDSSFLSSVVADEKVPPCLRRSGFAQAGLKFFQYPRSPSVRINFFTASLFQRGKLTSPPLGLWPGGPLAKGRQGGIFKALKYYKWVSSSELKNRARTEMFRVASKGRTYYGDFDITKNVIPTMVIAVPVERGRGKPNGVLVAQIHLRSIWVVDETMESRRKKFLS